MSTKQAYWAANIRLMTILMVIWFIVSFGCGILLADALNGIQIGGYKLGFWFGQQGAIYAFLIIIFVYAVKMKKLDREHGVED